MKKTLTTLWLLLLTVGVVFPNFYESLFDRFQFGAVSFPTSLDVFSNPGATDSVATVVTHSTHHGNANDALENIEAKVGITASTPITGSLFAGNGTGSSLWTTYATGTQAYFANFFATGSSTLNNFTFVNATGTQATTTSFFSTNASTTNLSGTNINGFGLTPCTGTNFLQWTGGIISCAAQQVAGTFSAAIASTSTQYNAKTLAMTNGDKVLWWGSCLRDAAGISMTAGYKTSNDGATTTVGTVSTGHTSLPIYGYFTATTTYDVTIEIAPSTTCDETQFMYLLIE